MRAPDDPLGPLLGRDGDPVFDEPWQAQALAMADSLVQKGTFSARDWTEALGAQLRAMTDTGHPDTAETYYEAVLAALENLLNEIGAAVEVEIQARRDDWESAYFNTPHGQPVKLSAATKK